MKTIYKFNCFPPRIDDSDNHDEIVLVESTSRKNARKFLEVRGFYGIEDRGVDKVYVDNLIN